MTYGHTQYSASIRCSPEIVNKTFQTRSNRYRGSGRPRNSDYDHKTMYELAQEAKSRLEMEMDKVIAKEILK